MKTRILFRLSLVALAFAFSVTACKKDGSTSSSSSTTSTSDVQTATDDQSMVTTQNDAISGDATAALNANSSISGGTAYETPASKGGSSTLGANITLRSLCGANVTYDTANGSRIVTIVYDGTDCLGRFTKTGKIVITMSNNGHWRTVGATVNIDVDSITLTRKSDGKSIIINGTKTITNTSGGLLLDLATLDSVVHDYTANLEITYPNGKTKTWTESKHHVFTYNGGLVETTTGGETGVNRFGVSYTVTITQPKVIAQSCDFNLVSGQDSLVRADNITSSITYGLTSTGAAQSSCPLPNSWLYAELIWKNGNNGKTYTYIFPYYSTNFLTSKEQLS
jgi:hypothetical protein